MGSGGGKSLEKEPVVSIEISVASSVLVLKSSEKEKTGSDDKTCIYIDIDTSLVLVSSGLLGAAESFSVLVLISG